MSAIFETGDVVKVSTSAGFSDEVYGTVMDTKMLLGMSIPGEDIRGPYHLIKCAGNKYVCARRADIAVATQNEIAIELQALLKDYDYIADKMNQLSEVKSNIKNKKSRKKK